MNKIRFRERSDPESKSWLDKPYAQVAMYLAFARFL